MKVRDSLGWLQLTRQKGRLLVAIAGIAFACILIFVQWGFLEALFSGATRPHRLLDADIVVAHPKLETFFSPKGFPRERLYQAAGVEGVESVSPVRLGTMQWRNPVSKQVRAILIFGVDPSKSTFDLGEFALNKHELTKFRYLLFDRKSRSEYGPIPQLMENADTIGVELNGKKVNVVGLFDLGASFAADGTAICSDTTFSYLFGRRHADTIEFGLIRCVGNSASEVEQVKQRLRVLYGDEVAVYTKNEFADLEKGYWANSTGIGFIFGLGVVVGFIVGVVIVYQILYSDVADHLPEYATLKAIGYADSYFLNVLGQEALILSCAGFLPGLFASIGIYWIAQGATALPITMTWERATSVFFLSLLMCGISAAIALTRLREADPADVF